MARIANSLPVKAILTFARNNSAYIAGTSIVKVDHSYSAMLLSISHDTFSPKIWKSGPAALSLEPVFDLEKEMCTNKLLTSVLF